jgi:hypothetical protein
VWAGNKLRRCGAKEVNKLVLMIANGTRNRNRMTALTNPSVGRQQAEYRYV